MQIDSLSIGTLQRFRSTNLGGLAQIGNRNVYFYSQSTRVRIFTSAPYTYPPPSALQSLPPSRGHHPRRHKDVFSYVKTELYYRFPRLNVNYVDTVEDAEGNVTIIINGYTSEDHYKTNKDMNQLVSQAVAEKKKDNPQVFNRIVIKMQESEADHLTFSLLLDALGMSREEASTILLSHADHVTKNQIDFSRPHDIEDVVDFLE